MYFITDNIHAFFSVNVIEILSIRCSICGTGFVRLRNANSIRSYFNCKFARLRNYENIINGVIIRVGGRDGMRNSAIRRIWLAWKKTTFGQTETVAESTSSGQHKGEIRAYSPWAHRELDDDLPFRPSDVCRETNKTVSKRHRDVAVDVQIVERVVRGTSVVVAYTVPF